MKDFLFPDGLFALISPENVIFKRGTDPEKENGCRYYDYPTQNIYS